jgi:hypothetical protein
MSSEGGGIVDPAGEIVPETDGIDELLRALEEGIREAVAGFSDAFESAVAEPLRETLAEIARAHGAAMAEAALQSDTDVGAASSDSMDLAEPVIWCRCSSYRKATLTECLEPLQGILLSRNTGQDLEAAWASFRADLARLVAALPAAVSRDEPRDMYLPRQGDSLAVKVGKSLVRTRRLVSSVPRKAGNSLRRIRRQTPAPPPIQTQVIPIRPLAEECFLGTFASDTEGLRGELHRSCAAPLAAFESAVTRWTREWPLVEMRLEKAEGYLPRELDLSISKALRSIQGEIPSSTAPTQGASRREREKSAASATIEGSPTTPDTVAEGLAQGLLPGEQFSLPVDVFRRLDESVEMAWGEFCEHIRVAGSFLGPSSSGASVRRAEKRAREQARTAEAWVRWHRSLPNRLLLSIHLLRLLEAIAEAREGLVKGVAETALLPLAELRESSAREFGALADRADEVFSEEDRQADPDQLAEEVRGLLEAGTGIVEGSWLPILAPDGIEKSIRELADGASTGLAGRLPKLPDQVSVQGLQPVDGPLSPSRELQEVTVREATRQVMDVLRLEGIRKAPEPLIETLHTIREEVAGLPEALRFNLEAAREELAETGAGSDEGGKQEAASFTREGLSRAEEGVDRLLRGLPEAWHAFVQVTEDLLGAAFRDVHGRLTLESGVQTQLIGFRHQVLYRVRDLHHRTRMTVEGAGRKLRRRIQKWAIQGFRVIRFGRKVVGAAPVETGEGDRALSLIRQAPEVLAGLPLIYRRLFSFEPLTDAGLLKGRSEEQNWVQTRFETWKNGLGSPALLTGPVGAGHTSFFNVLSDSLFSDTRLHRLELTERIRGEDGLVALLCRAFEFSVDRESSLADLGPLIRAPASGGRPWVVLIERLEHIFLRTPGGTNLFEDFLSFQAQTSRHVFWLSSMSGAAWKLVAKTEPRAASLVHSYPLTPPTREELEELILARHRRSGLPLDFRTPGDLNPLVRRRLRLSRGEKAHQKILRTEYFDRLHRLSQDSIPLAILYWLRSTDFKSGEGTLFLTPPSEIKYAFLDDLDLELDFALKAFLEHGSLTLTEYREVFAASEDESVQTFEALRSRLLLEPTGLGGGMRETVEKNIVEGTAYRIPALLSQVVARRLKNRNILH